MPIESILDAARAGLSYERLRLDAASRNIAGANVPVAPGRQPQLWRADAGAADFRALVSGMPAPTLDKHVAQVREVHDPGHPLADPNGMVRYPAVDLVDEMTTLMTASRGYEANVRSFNLLRSMMLRALELGAK